MSGGQGVTVGIIARGTVLTDVEDLEEDTATDFGLRVSTSSRAFNPESPYESTASLPKPILRSTLLGHPILGRLGVLTAPQGTNYPVKPEENAGARGVDRRQTRPRVPAQPKERGRNLGHCRGRGSPAVAGVPQPRDRRHSLGALGDLSQFGSRDALSRAWRNGRR